MSYGKSGIAQYQQTGSQAANYADPWQLTQMLFNGALDRVAQARNALQQGDAGRKGERIGKAIAIIDALRTSLDHATGGQLAANLDSLYEYLQRRLLAANLHSDDAALAEVARLLREIKEGWDAIPPEARSAHQQRAGGRHVSTG